MARPRVSIRTILSGGGGSLSPSTFTARDSVEAAASAHAISDLALDFLAASTAAGMRAEIAAAAVPSISTPASSAGVLTFDFAGQHSAVFAVTLTENVTSLAFANLPASGYVEYEAHFVQDGTGGRTVALPASHKALGGSDTTVAGAAGKVTVLTASTIDSGTTWRFSMQESA